jgi:CcmD family protein
VKMHRYADLPAPAATVPSADDRSTAFRPVEGGTEMQSGEKLLVEAYAAIWLILFAFVLISWRRQRKLDERVASLEAAVEAARREEATPKGGA